MDFVNQTLAQVRDLFDTMTPGARVTAGLLLAVVVVSIGFLFQQAASGPDEYLFGATPVSRAQLPRMEAAMSSAGVEFTTEGNRIRVARSDKNAAIAAIADAGELPPDFFRLMDDAMSRGSMLDDSQTKRRRIESAREQQASFIISEMRWVEQAHVMYNQRESRGLRASRRSSAAVSILPAAGEEFNPKRVRTIKSLVANALDVTSENISVTNLGDDSVFASDGVSPEDFENEYYRLKTQYEQKLKQEIRQVLSYIPNVQVGVKAELDETESRRLVQVKPEKDSVELQAKTLEDTTDKVVGPAGNRPGVETNSATGPVGRDDALAREDRTKATIDKQDRSFAVGSSQEITDTIGFTPKEAEAAIGVPRSYLEKVFQDQNREEGGDPAPIDQAKIAQLEERMEEEIRNLVKPLLPKLSLGEDEYKQVNVAFYHDLPKDPIPEPSAASNALALAGRYWDTIAMGGLAIFSLVMLRSMVSSSGSEPSAPAPSIQLADTFDDQEEEEDDPTRPKLKLSKPDTYKDDLSEMVNSDPDAAAAILRSWINNAG